MGRGRSRVQAFWRRQNLAAGGIHFRRGCQIPVGPPFDARIKWGGGDKRDRTADPLLAKQVLSQLSYTPTFISKGVRPLN